MSFREEDIRDVNLALAEATVDFAIISGDETPKQSDKESIDDFIKLLQKISEVYQQVFNESATRPEPELSGGRMTRKVGGNRFLRTTGRLLNVFSKRRTMRISHTGRNVLGSLLSEHPLSKAKFDKIYDGDLSIENKVKILEDKMSTIIELIANDTDKSKLKKGNNELKLETLLKIYDLWDDKYNYKFANFYGRLKRVHRNMERYKKKGIPYLEAIEKILNTPGLAATINDVIRVISGELRGEHSYPVDEVVRIFVIVSYEKYIPIFSSLRVIAESLRSTVIRKFPKIENLALNNFFTRAHGEILKNPSLTLEGAFKHVLEDCSGEKQINFRKVLLNMGENPVKMAFERREEAFINFIKYIVIRNRKYKDKYFVRFLQRAIYYFKSSDAFNMEELIKRLSSQHITDAELEPLTDDEIKEYTEQPPQHGGNPLSRIATAALRAVTQPRGTSRFLAPSARPLLAHPFTLAPPSRSFSTRADPPDRRYTVAEFNEFKTGNELRALIPNNIAESLGLKKGMPIDIVKHAAFKNLVSRGKIAGPPAQIKIAGLSYEIAALERTKGPKDEVAKLKHSLSKLVGEHGVDVGLNRGSLAGPAAHGNAGETAVEEEVSSIASQAAAERELLKIGGKEPSHVVPELLDITPKSATEGAEAATKLYADFTGKADPILLTKEGLAAEGKAEALPEGKESAVSLLERVKAYTPYAKALTALSGNLTLAKKNVNTFRVLAVNIADEAQAMKKYNTLVSDGLKIILEHTTKRDIDKLLKVFTPQRMINFKAAMVTMFSRSPSDAATIFNLMVTHIIPNNNYDEKLIDSLIIQIRLHPADAVEEIRKLAASIIAEEVKTLAAKIQAAEKGKGWFKMKTFYTLLLAGGGCVVLFLANYMNTPDLKSFAIAVGDKKEELFKMLEGNPDYKTAVGVGNSIRDSILIHVLKQAPPEPPIEPRPTWTHSIMKAMGYDPEKGEDRRKFAELGDKTREVSGDILVKSLVAGATAAAVAAARKLVNP